MPLSTILFKGKSFFKLDDLSLAQLHNQGVHNILAPAKVQSAMAAKVKLHGQWATNPFLYHPIVVRCDSPNTNGSILAQ